MSSPNLRERIARLRTERDELRVQLRLGELEARDALERLSEQLSSLETHFEAAAEATTHALSDTVDRIAHSFEQLRKQSKERVPQPGGQK